MNAHPRPILNPHRPSRSTEKWVPILKLASHRLLVLVAVFILAEAILGGTFALRWTWQSRTHDKRDMFRCELLSLSGRHEHNDYFPLVGFYKTDRTAGRAIARTLANLIER